MRSKLLTTIGILWIVGAFFFMAFIYERDVSWSRFPTNFTDQFLAGFMLYSIPGIAILLFNTIYEISQMQKYDTQLVVSKGVEVGNKEPSISHQEKSWMFLSYRRADSADISGRIYDRLVEQFGKGAVFKDVDSIPLGLDFRHILNQAVSQSSIFIAIIGPNWFGQINGQAIRRVDDPADFVRIELLSALKKGIPVIPLLVYGATMPRENELPEELKPLAYRNGTVVRPDPDFNNDMKRVVSSIYRLIESSDKDSG